MHFYAFFMPSLASIESSALVRSFLYDISCPIFIFEAIEFSRRFISFSTCAKEKDPVEIEPKVETQSLEEWIFRATLLAI